MFGRNLPCSGSGVWHSNWMRTASGGIASPGENPGPDVTTRDQTGKSWLVRAVPSFIVGGGLVILVGALFIATRSGLSARPAREVTVGPFHMLVVYTTPSLTMVLAGVLTAVAVSLLVHGVARLAA